MITNCAECYFLVECAIKCQELGKTQAEVCPCKEAEDYVMLEKEEDEDQHGRDTQ